MSNSDTAASNAAAAGIKSPRYRNNSATTNVAFVAKARRGCATNRCRIASGKPAALRSSRKMATNRLTGARKGFNRIPPPMAKFSAQYAALSFQRALQFAPDDGKAGLDRGPVPTNPLGSEP
jgi:hypothetical protein